MQSIDVFLDSTHEFLHQLALLLPRLLLAIVVVALGWLIAKIARFALEKALRAVNFNVLTERAGTDRFLQQGGLQGDTTTVFGAFVYWVVILAALMIASNELGMTYTSDLLSRAMLFMPKVFVAMLVVIFGSYFATFVGNAVQTYCMDAQIPDGDVLGRISRYLIMTFVVMIALSHVEIGGDIVQRTFLIILAGFVLALALAFGLGGRNWAASLLQRWWPQARHDDELR